MRHSDGKLSLVGIAFVVQVEESSSLIETHEDWHRFRIFIKLKTALVRKANVVQEIWITDDKLGHKFVKLLSSIQNIII